jgi:hypothetical protein
MKRTNWAARFQKHSTMGVDFGAKRTAGFGSDFEHPQTMDHTPHLVSLPEAVNHPPDYDVFGGSSGFGAVGRGKAMSRFGIGTVIPSMPKPKPVPDQDVPPPVEDHTASLGFGADDEPKKSGGILTSILAFIGLFTVGIFLDAAIERRLGPDHKPIALFKR